MTFIGVSTHRDRAELVTDSWAYTAGAAQLSRAQKLIPIPHLDAAVVTHGLSSFGFRTNAMAIDLAESVLHLDELVDRSAEQLRSIWAGLPDRHLPGVFGRAVVAGYSSAAGGFRAWLLPSETDFTPEVLGEPVVFPAPLTVRPHPLEAASNRAAFARTPREGDEDALAAWEGRPGLGRGVDWVHVANTARSDRTLCRQGYQRVKTLVGGDLYRTTLRVGHITTERVHAFNDAGDELVEALSGSLHPIGQLGPCACGSRRRALDCCLAGRDDQPCPCGSDRAFAACCRVGSDFVAALS